MIDAKKILMKVRRQAAYVNTLEEELRQLRIEAVHLKSPRLGDAVQNNHQSDLAETVERIEEYASKVQTEVDRLIQMKLEAETLIKTDPDKARQAVLRRRYFLCQSWSEIANAMHYGKDHVFRMHRESLGLLDYFLDGTEHASK